MNVLNFKKNGIPLPRIAINNSRNGYYYQDYINGRITDRFQLVNLYVREVTQDFISLEL